MMIVDMYVSLALQGDVEPTVLCKLCEHMIEEAYTGAYTAISLT